MVQVARFYITEVAVDRISVFSFNMFGIGGSYDQSL